MAEDENNAENSADLSDSQLWASLSEQKLRTARKHLADGEYRDAVSDAYYAMFHIARAALTASGVESRRHTGVASHFAEEFVKTGRVDKELSRTLMRGLQLREDADYAPRTIINEEKAKQAVAEAEAFVTQAKVFVERKDS